jgi:hypothetical protein
VLIVNSAAQDGLRELQPTIQALRDKDYEALRAAHPDVVIDYIDLHVLQVIKAFDEQKKKGKRGVSTKAVGNTRGGKTGEGTSTRGGTATKPKAKPKPKAQGAVTPRGSNVKAPKRSGPGGGSAGSQTREGGPAATPVPGGLIESVIEGRANGLSAYEALQQAGHTASGDFLPTDGKV